MHRLHLDYETFSEADLLKTGTDVYARHHSTENLMLAYALDDGDVQQWVPMEHGFEMPADLREMLHDPGVVKIAWNKPFEWSITTHVEGIEVPHNHWRDPMVMALSLSLPGKLSKCGEVVGLPEDKLKDRRGRTLIQKFTKPRKPTKNLKHTRNMPEHDPEAWEEFKDYNRQDVISERAVYKRVAKYADRSRAEWELWLLDQEINQRGIPINMRMVENAIEVYEALVADRLAEMRDLTGLVNPNSNAQLLPWLQGEGYVFDDIVAAHVKRGLERAEREGRVTLARVLELRSEVSKTSPKKFHALKRAVDGSSGRIRNAFQFQGAGRTGRWAGRLFQAQNLPRPAKSLEKALPQHADNLEHLTAEGIELVYEHPFELLKSCIRPAAQAPEGMMFIDADLSAIENRVLGWMADCGKILEVFEKGRDPYIDFSKYLYGSTYNDELARYKGGDGSRRQIAKPGVLGCGYQLGPGHRYEDEQTGEEEATGLLGYAWNMGITEFTEADAEHSVETFRREFEEVTQFWNDIENAAKRCIRTGEETAISHYSFRLEGPFLRLRLPSGRDLSYVRPQIEQKMMPWGKVKDTITYEQENDKRQWVRMTTYGGKLTENADQATARDLLAHGMLLASQEGIPICLHVHDQIVGLVPEDEADDALALLRECMRAQPAWAKGLPMDCGGFISRVFMKD